MSSTEAEFIDTYMDIAEAATFMSETFGRPYSYDQVRRMADAKRLPFFKDPAGKRVIGKRTLLAHFRRAQLEAERACKDAAKGR